VNQNVGQFPTRRRQRRLDAVQLPGHRSPRSAPVADRAQHAEIVFEAREKPNLTRDAGFRFKRS